MERVGGAGVRDIFAFSSMHTKVSKSAKLHFVLGVLLILLEKHYK